MLLITVNKCCYVSASVVQVSELMQRRQQSACTTPLFLPLCQCLSFTFSPISSFTISKKPLISHTYAHPHSFPGIQKHNFLVLESCDLSDRDRESERTDNLFVQSDCCFSEVMKKFKAFLSFLIKLLH